MPQNITAPLPGTVSTVNINIGDEVEADEEALVIEAMKMETPVWVPCDGTVKNVFVKKGDEVEENDLLAVIEEA
jgi:acetyl-CoA carboxylase biotin carboxyl carrier protein